MRKPRRVVAFELSHELHPENHRAMKTSPRRKQLGRFAGIAVAVVAGLLVVSHSVSAEGPQAAISPGDSTAAELAALRKEIEGLKGKAPDQSHAMKGVAYHFTNLWFAGQHQNWPLAKFYLDETRSHLKWAVRIIPVRKTKAGDLELQGILDAVDNSMLSEVGKSIENKDVDGFRASYRKSLEGCYSCHKAAEKPYLRPQIPSAPPQPIINFDPDARWPE